WLLSLISGLTARRAAPRLLRLSLTVLRRLVRLRPLRATRATRAIPALMARRATRAILAPLVALARRATRATRATPARMGPTASRPRRSGTTWLPASRRSKRPRPEGRGRHGLGYTG